MNWLLSDNLLVNTSKTELLNISRIPIIYPSVIIDGKLILPSDSVRNIGVIMDSTSYFGHHINTISKSANDHLSQRFPIFFLVTLFDNT